MDLVKHLPWAFAWRDRLGDEGMVKANSYMLRGIIEWLIGVDCSVNLSGCFD